MNLSRRGLLGGLAALVAAPAIVRVESLMALPAKAGLILPEGFGQTLRIRLPNDFVISDGPGLALQETVERNSLLTINMITREAVELFRNSNLFLQSIDAQYGREFGKHPCLVASEMNMARSNFADWSRKIAA